MREQLQFMGFDEKTIALYCAGIEIGPSTAQKFAKKIDVKRPSIYPLLERLMERGLVTRTVIGTKILYEMANPSVIKDLLKERESQISKLLVTLPQEIKRLTPKEQQGHTPHVRVAQGEREFWRIVDTVQRSRGEICWMGNLEGLLRHVPEKELFQRFSAKHMRRKVTTRAITDSSIKSFRLFNEQVGSYRQFRFVDHLDSPVIVALWENKIGILDPENDFSLIMIEEGTISSFFRLVFDALWNSLKN